MLLLNWQDQVWVTKNSICDPSLPVIFVFMLNFEMIINAANQIQLQQSSEYTSLL